MFPNKIVSAGLFLASVLVICDCANDFVSFENFLEEKTMNVSVLKGWENFEKSIRDISNFAVKLILPKMMESSPSLNISSECIRDSMMLISGVRTIKPWAMKFLDSSAKVINGFFGGSMSSFGVYDECVNNVVTSSKPRDKGKVLFRGKYCTIDVKPPLPPKRKYYKLNEVLHELKNFSQGGTAISEAARYAHFFYFLSLRSGVCVPSGCSIHDINKLASLLGKALSVNALASRCETKEENQFTPLVIFVISAFSFAGFLMLIGSLIDIYAYYTNAVFRSKAMRVLLAFSILTNFKKFVCTKSEADHLSCLNGVRFICMTWVVLGHTYLVFNLQLFIGLQKFREYGRDFAFQVIINASVGVDTFFFMGGLLVCYWTIKLVKERGQKFNIIYYITHRLWRIVPVYAFVILFMFLRDFLGSGPIWHEMTDNHVNACYKNWWANLLFINNFYDSKHICITPSWYIASDFQLFIAAIFILLPLLRWPKCGIALCVLVIISSIVYSGIGTYVLEYPPTMLFSHPDPDARNNYWANFYFRPFVHAGPYCIGMLAGYLLAVKPDLKIPGLVLVVGWCVAFICSFSVLYGAAEWNRGTDPTFWEGMLYASFNRVAWTFGIAWMVVCCATGHGGVINYILTWKAFIPLSRLSFVVFLIHPIIQISVVGNIRTQLQPDHFLYVWFFFGNLCVTYASAFAGSMLIEAPILALEKIIFPRTGVKTETAPPVFDKSSVFKGTLTVEKNGEIAVISPGTDNDSLGMDNDVVVYKL